MMSPSVSISSLPSASRSVLHSLRSFHTSRSGAEGVRSEASGDGRRPEREENRVNHKGMKEIRGLHGYLQHK